MPSQPPRRARVLHDLRRRIAQNSSDRQLEEACFSTGALALDRLLPGNGLRQGTIVEWLAPFAGSGAGTLALLAARQACRSPSHHSQSHQTVVHSRGSTLVVVDSQHQFYPPAVFAWGIGPERLLLIQPRNHADALWAATQALACEAVAAVWASWDRLDVRSARRLQLAAKQGRTLGVFLRPSSARAQPSWSNIQFLVTPRATEMARLEVGDRQPLENRCVEIRVVRCQGKVPTRSVYLQIDQMTGELREMSAPRRQVQPFAASRNAAF